MSDAEDTHRNEASDEERKRTSHDQIFKTLFSHFLQDLVELLDPDLASALDLRAPTFLRGETFTDEPQGERVDADLVAEARTRGGEPRLVLVHVETEGKFRRVMDRRTWRYFMHLKLKYDRPVVSIVVFLTGGTPGVHRREVVEAVGAFEVNRFSYLGFGLSGSLAEHYVDRPQPLAAALAALMRSKVWDNVERKLRCLRAVGRAAVNEAQKFLLGNVVETYLKLDPQDEERFAAEIRRDTNKEVRDMVITWEDALAASREEGLEAGLLQGEASVLRRLLKRRFTEVPPQVEKRLEQAGRQDLESWAERVLDAERLEDVFGSE